MARRALLTGAVLRVSVDLELSPETAREYTAADGAGRRGLVDRLLAERARALDYEPPLAPFYEGACGRRFTPAALFEI